MKKIFTLLSVAFVINANSQSSLLVTNTENTTTVSANGVVQLTTTPNHNTSIVFDIKNIGTTSKTYSVKRYDVVLNSSNTETASAFFCFAGGCYPDITMVSPSNITLNAGQSASDIHSTYQMLTTDLAEISSVGYSLVKYTFFNTTTASDSIQFSLRYNGAVIPTGVKETNNPLSLIDLYPNPTSDNANLKINALTAADSKITVYSSIGEIVFDKNVSLIAGENLIKMNLEHLSAGVYFTKIQSGNSSTIKKIIIK